MTPSLIDLHHLDMIGGISDPEVLELVDEFIAEMPDYLGRIGNAVSIGDPKLLRETAHSIRGVAGMLGFQLVAATSAEADLPIPPADPHEWLARMTRHCTDSVDEWSRIKFIESAGSN